MSDKEPKPTETPKRQVKAWAKTFIWSGNRITLVRRREEDDIFARADMFDCYGKEDGCLPYGRWVDWVNLARQILAHENTRLAMPEFYQPDLQTGNDDWEAQYEMVEPSEEK